MALCLGFNAMSICLKLTNKILFTPAATKCIVMHANQFICYPQHVFEETRNCCMKHLEKLQVKHPLNYTSNNV